MIFKYLSLSPFHPTPLLLSAPSSKSPQKLRTINSFYGSYILYNDLSAFNSVGSCKLEVVGIC